MANLNLSQFTEKTFVADADHTFIWDTVGAISKRVSRNSWLNSGTLTSDAPVTISQTWNNAAVAFTGLKVNATSTNSAAASLLLDLQVGTVSQFSVRKDGFVQVAGGMASPGGIYTSASANLSFGWLNSYTFGLSSAGILGWTSGSDARGAPDTILLRDGAANTLALRNGANAQTFNVYGTYTSGTSYERLTLSAPSAANAIIGTNKGSGGGTARGLEFQTDGVTRMTIGSSSGNLSITGGSITSPSGGTWSQPSAIELVSGGHIRWLDRSRIYSSADGIFALYNSATTGFDRLQFGGTSASFPALKRSTTTLQSRLADDSAFAPIQGKLTTDTAFTATTVVPTGFITLYDSTGTAYKVPCVPA